MEPEVFCWEIYIYIYIYLAEKKERIIAIGLFEERMWMVGKSDFFTVKIQKSRESSGWFWAVRFAQLESRMG
jgi:hypothetical protein